MRMRPLYPANPAPMPAAYPSLVSLARASMVPPAMVMSPGRSLWPLLAQMPAPYFPPHA